LLKHSDVSGGGGNATRPLLRGGDAEELHGDTAKTAIALQGEAILLVTSR